MPAVVLRHPEINVPTVVEVGPDGLVPRWYADSGFTIDTATDPTVAAQEINDYAVAAAEKAAAEVSEPRFAPAVNPETGGPSDGTPAEQTAAGQTAVVTRSTPNPAPAEPVNPQE